MAAGTETKDDMETTKVVRHIVSSHSLPTITETAGLTRTKHFAIGMSDTVRERGNAMTLIYALRQM